MLSLRTILAASLLLWTTAEAAPQQRNRNGNGNSRGKQTAQQQAARVPQGISQATDGSIILDTTETINGLQIRYRISAPPEQFTTESSVPGGTASPNAEGSMGINVLLHGDGGQSFFDFPNQGVQSNLMGVAVLAPNANLFWGGGSGLQRTDGVAHAQAVNDLVTKVLPQQVAFNSSQVFFTGVSGGALLLSGFFIPTHMANFQGTGVLLNCAAMAPQVPFVNAAAVLGSTRIHFQSTLGELTLLQPAIPASIRAYERAAAAAGMDVASIGALQTVDNSPDGGHCAFDGRGFVSGVQLMADSFANVMLPGGNGSVAGIQGSVLTPTPGNENLVFAAGANKRDMVRELQVL
jgi:hypothetical protein